jgi:hypothetical protein
MSPHACQVPDGTFGTEAVSAKTQHTTSNDAMKKRLNAVIGSPGRKIEQNASTQPQIGLAGTFGDKETWGGESFIAERLPKREEKRFRQTGKQA